MKSAIKGLVALMLVLGMAAPALALDGDLKGYYQIRGIGGNVTLTEDNGQNFQGVDQRIRLWFTGALNENVKGVFAIENDVTWGDAEADYGIDFKSDLEIKHGYIQFKAMDATTTAGLQGFSYGRGFVIADDAPGLQIVKKFGDINLALAWIHAIEGNLADDGQDQDVYLAQVDLKAGGFSIVPLVAYVAQEKGLIVKAANDPTLGDPALTVSGASNIIFGGSVDGKVADVGLAFTLLGSSWEIDGAGANTDGFGVVAYGKASMDIAGIGVYAEAAYMGDEDAPGGQFQAVNNNTTKGGSAYNNFAEVLTGGMFDGRGTVGRQAVSDTHMNWVYGKLGAKAKIDAKSNVEGALIYAAEAVDSFDPRTGLTSDAKTYGFEVDAYYNRTLVDGLVMTVGGGYLFTDDDAVAAGSNADDAYKVGTALTYKF